MKTLVIISFLILIFTGDKLDPKDKVAVTFKATDGQVNTEANYAMGILKEYIQNKTSLVLVEKSESPEFTFVLSVYEVNKTNMGKIDILKAETGTPIFESPWTKGKATVYFGYSAVRHSIGTIFNKQILEKYPHIEADNRK